jgi:PKD repeat protein
MAVVGNRELGILIASLILVILASQAVPAEALTSITKVAVVAGDSAGISAISTQGGQKLIEDSFGKTIAVYVDGTGRIGLTYANSNPTIASNWVTPVKSSGASFGYNRPAAVLASPSSLRIIAEDGTGVGHINDLPVAISRDSQNNIIGLSFGTRVSLDTSGGAHYPAATLAHNGDILAVWWQNGTSSSIVKAFRWRPVGWRGFSGSSTVPDNAIVDTSDLEIIYPSLVQRGDNRHVYLFGNRAESSPNKNIVFNKATFGGTNWSWETQNLAYETNSARGLFDVPSAVWDPIRQLVVVIYDISGFERYAVFTLTSSDVKTHIDTPTLNIANNEWGNIELHEPTGEYYIFMIDSVDPVANHDNGRIGYVRYNGVSWETSLTIIDSDTNNIGISMKRTGSNSTMEFLYTDNSGGSPNQLKFVRILQVENASTVVFTATEDASVIADQPNTNFGTAATLEVDSGPVAKNFLLKFQLSGLPSHQPIEGRLRLFCATTSGASSNRGGDFYTTSDSWTETTVTWNNASGVVPGLVASLGAVSSNSWVEVDITSIITGNGPLNIKVLPASSDGADYSSSEGTNPPELVITFSNSPPVLSPIGSKNVSEGTLLTFAATATDADNDLLTFSLGAGAPVGASITPAGLFSWTPAENQGPNSQQVTVIVSDGNLGDNETISITVNEVNRPPLLTVPGPLTVSEEDLLTFTVTASDPDLPANTVTLSFSGLPPGATFNPVTGAFTWAPSESQGPGDYTVTFTATDNGLPTMSNSSTMAIHVNEANLAPSLSVPGAQTINELQPLTFTVNATDPDIPANPVTLACANCASIGATFNPGTGQFSWTPTEDQGPGDFTVTFTATDNGVPMSSDNKTLNIHVNEVNQPPTLTVPADQSVDEGDSLTFSVSTVDSDLPSNVVSLSAPSLPGGASFDPSTGTFSWTPTPGQQGTYVVLFTASDNGSPQLSDSKNVTIVVKAAVLVVDFDFTAAATSKPVNFNASASGGTPPYVFGWDFGDGSTGVGVTVSHSYSVKGSYNVTLAVTDSANRTGNTSTMVSVSPQPLQATISHSQAASGKPVAFTALPVGGTGPYAVAWRFGDGTTGSGTSTTHIFPVKGAYAVLANVTDANGLVASVTVSVIVSPQPLVAEFVSSSPTAGKPVSFNATASGGTSPYVFTWGFGDGTGTSTGTSASHVYSAKGTYNVTLVVLDSNSATTTTNRLVTVTPQPLVLILTVSGATAGKPASFTASVAGGTGPYTLIWDFGDNSTGTGGSVSHAYATKGAYATTVSVTDANNASSRTTQTVAVTPQPLTAIASCGTATSGKSVACSASASGGTSPYLFSWDVSEDGTVEGTGPNFAFTFPTKGTFALTVNVTDANSTSASTTVSVAVNPQPLLVTVACPDVGLTAGKPFSCDVSAAGGSSPYTGTGSQSVALPVKGTYTVGFTVTDANGASATGADSVIIAPQPLAITVSCPDAGLTAGKPFTCAVSAAGGTSPYTGTGSQSVVFPVKGTYNVSLAVTDANGANATGSDSVVISPQPLTITASCSTATAGKPAACSANASGGTGPYSFTWDVAKDGTIDGTGAGFDAVFPVKGSYSIDAIVHDANGDTARVNVPVTIAPQPLTVTGSCQSGTAGKPVTCTASSTGGTQPYAFTWDVGKDGTIEGTEPDFVTSFAVKGSYSVDTIVADANGQIASVNLAVTVAPQPLSSDFASSSPRIIGQPVNFTATASGGTSPYTFAWNFGDGGSGSGSTVSHTYSVKGIYNVTLAVADANNSTFSVSRQLGVSGQVVTLTALCNNGTTGKPLTCNASVSGGTAPYIIAWTFGDGGTGSGFSVSHVFTVKGTYVVTVNVTDANLASATRTLQVSVAPQPLLVDFAISPSSPLAGEPVTLTASVSGGTTPYAFSWSFGDGSNGVGSPVSHTYGVKGSYNISLVVTEANNVVGMVSRPLTVSGQPLTASITAGDATSGKPVTLSATASGGTAPYTISWDFGDSSTEPGATVSHIYNVKGSYTVRAIVTDANLGNTTSTIVMVVTPQPLAMTASCGQATVGKPVTCTGSASGGTSPYSFSWDLGKDGTVDGTEPSFTHVFPAKGAFSIDATVRDANNATSTVNLSVVANPQPLTVSAQCSSGTSGKPVNCSSSGSGGTLPYVFGWDVGKDGSFETTGSNFTWTFPVKGPYSVDAVLIDANGAIASVNIPVTVAPQPLAASISTTTRPAGSPTNFSALISGGTAPYTVFWSFGDGANSTGNPVSHVYAVKGSYNATAVITDANAQNTSSTVMVNIAPQPLQVNAQCDTGGTAGKPINCEAIVSGGTAPYSFAWNFGDGETGSGTPVFHVYSVKGSYNVTLIVSDANSAATILSRVVLLAPQPLTVNAFCDTAIVGVPVTCTASLSGGTSPYSFSWIFSDGGAGSGPSVNHTFAAKGLYTVTVNATDANLASASLSFQVAVSPEPLLVSFDFSPSLPSAGKPVSFNATASGGTSPYSFNWSFGDGTNGVGGSMGHTYVVKGSYNVSLTVTDVNGAVATVSRTLTVSAQPLVALINAGNATAGKPATLSLSVSGGTGPYLVVWDFGDNSTGTGETASHVYSVKGSYTVTATATDFNSATAVASVTVTVIPQPLVVSAICGQATAGKPVFCDSATSGGTGPYQFSWDLGKDGTIDGTSSSFTTVFSVKGSYSVDAIVADANGATASINLVVAVGPQPLTVTPQCSDGTAGKPVFCSASASGGTSPYVFGWDVGKDGSVDGTGSNLTTTFPVKGSYSVDVVVIDANDASNRVNLVVRVLPQPFTADFTIDGTSVAGVSLNFTATASGGTPPYLFAWMFGDGNSGTGSGATHIYTVKGSYTVTLNVTDANGTMLSISRGIVVAPQPLTVTISPSSATAGNPVEFTATITGGTGPYSVSWTFGDATNGSGNPVTHVYSVKGSYNVSATVMDVNGEVMVSTLSVIVAPQPLLADFTMSAGTVSVGEDLVLAATVSGGTPPYLFSWSFGDGLTAAGGNVIHAYSVKGSYTVTLNATDVNGAVSTSAKTVAVLPLPLVISGVNVVPAQPSVGDAATFTATITGGTAPYMVVWDLTGDNVSDAQGNPVGWTYSLAQNVTIRVYANDANGATSPVVTTTITVVPFPISEFQFDWADADNSGKVDIVDVATAAACFDLTSSSPAWSGCAYWDFDLDDRIGIVEIAMVADQFDTIVTSPFPGEDQAAGVMDPQWHEFCYLLAPIDRAYCESRLG